MNRSRCEVPQSKAVGARGAALEAVYPQAFSGPRRSAGADVYLGESVIGELAEFFEGMGLSALKEQDREEQWYSDWLTFQADRGLYARLLSPRQFSRLGTSFDLLRYTRFLEVCGYFSPAHGYSLQVTFLGLFAILMGSNPALKREAVAALEAGGLLAFGVSEKSHGSDLLGNEFTVTQSAPHDDSTDGGSLVANGSKYYIGNSNCAAIISVLARKVEPKNIGRPKRAPMVLFALRPGQSKGYRSVRKIRTLGVRSAFVGEFEVTNHELPESDVVAEGRSAWDAVFGTVTLGKFFLGFGSIGICERAWQEAAGRLGGRMLYGKRAIEMPHIRSTMAQAYARLTAMKLYAYRALDYVHAASEGDRRYLLYTAVQKAKLSTEGVKVMALLSECIGARGFEADTYFEMALRDVQLIPGLEGSAHINLGLTAQFMPRYFDRAGADLVEPASLSAGEVASVENEYLFEARTSAVNTIAFTHCLNAFRPLIAVRNVRHFAEQAKAFQLLIRGLNLALTGRADTPLTQAAGKCLATVAYGQLVAESALRFGVPGPLVAAMFQALVHDFSQAALTFLSCMESEKVEDATIGHPIGRSLPRRLVRPAGLCDADGEFVAGHMAATNGFGAAVGTKVDSELHSSQTGASGSTG